MQSLVGASALLEELAVERSCVRLSDVFDDGDTLFDAVVEHGVEGVVAKKRNGIYRPGYRGWTRSRTRRTGDAIQKSRMQRHAPASVAGRR